MTRLILRILSHDDTRLLSPVRAANAPRVLYQPVFRSHRGLLQTNQRRGWSSLNIVLLLLVALLVGVVLYQAVEIPARVIETTTSTATSTATTTETVTGGTLQTVPTSTTTATLTSVSTGSTTVTVTSTTYTIQTTTKTETFGSTTTITTIVGASLPPP